MIISQVRQDYYTLKEALSTNSDRAVQVKKYLELKYGKRAYKQLFKRAWKEIHNKYLKGKFEFTPYQIPEKNINKDYFGSENDKLYIHKKAI